MWSSRELPRVAEYVVPGISASWEGHSVLFRDTMKKKRDQLSMYQFAPVPGASMIETAYL
jgi:hypothetical protein